MQMNPSSRYPEGQIYGEIESGLGRPGRKECRGYELVGGEDGTVRKRTAMVTAQPQERTYCTTQLHTYKWLKW